MERSHCESKQALYRPLNFINDYQASAAVPGILNPVVLMEKTKDGNLIPWNWGSKFKDGSLRVDIPLQSLNHYFNGNELIGPFLVYM